MASQDIDQSKKKLSISNEDIQPESDATLLQHVPPVALLSLGVNTLHECADLAESELGYYHRPVQDAFDLPLSFDGPQAYIGLPQFLHQYSNMESGRENADIVFGFGDSAQSGCLGASKLSCKGQVGEIN
ncbi:hypothetical protein J3459_008534 [Metarhizium acridum]|uniref:uncharacterized protein n=1 Tax=Metarhizium acridum TaxID=92637 RepID=UPI001C6C3B4D|nr:hypothetical protein J3458_000214 [Metarhizium acridum]KAG8426000.1 hypothetical protein J3459_008534 [Metarhizium acridum]